MATSQSSFPSSPASQIKYDVFISFRGSDTRRGFLSHLLKALTQKNIEAYVDNKLKEGDELLPALLTAIEESQIALIILSEDYASSKWCLKELAKITECMMEKGQIVVPIFYEVDPSDVRHQKGCYKNAFDEHEKSLEDNINVEKWRAALKKVADLSGFHSTNFGTEAELIEVVINRVLKRLNDMYQVDFKGLVGIDKPIEYLQSLILRNISKDVHIIGIWGMGGIGKTTIAGALFSILRSEYDNCYFLANVREQSEKNGIIQLREKLLSILLEEKYLNIDVLDGTLPAHVLRRLRRKKVLLVLDDVNSLDHITSLVGGHDWFGPGSRIIVTTRDKHVLCKEADDIYEVKALGDQRSLQLLNLHAFDGKCPQINWHDLMHEVVAYAKGIPLALKVLGSFLYGKSVEEWESLLHKLQKMSFPEIQNILRLSYEGLDREEKSIYLYISCFFHCDGGDHIKTLLDACGYSTAIALKTLQDKSLVTISRAGYVTVHDLIREMGLEIVREQNIENPGERSHLWDSNDICRVLENEEGTEHIESISLNMTRPGDLSISPHAFARMANLKLLRIHNSHTCSKVHLPKGLQILPDKIRLLHWDNYPCKSFPTTFNGEYLIKLHMRNSHVKKLWNGAPNLPNLKIVDLDGSEQLIEVPDFSKATSLETVYLSHCANLISIHPSIFTLQKLVWLIVTFCTRLEKVPALEALPSSVRGCGKLQYLDFEGCESLKHLHGISKLTYLKSLDLPWCEQLNTSNLHMLFDGLQSLEKLCLDGCCNLYELPENISKLSYLLLLSLDGTNLKSLPECIKHLSQLRGLGLNKCRRLQSLPEIPASVCLLRANGCTSLERLFTPTRELLEEHNRLCESNPNNFRWTKFSFHNCPKLDKDALDAFLAYFNWMNKRASYSADTILRDELVFADDNALTWETVNRALGALGVGEPRPYSRQQIKKRKEPSSDDGPSIGATMANTRVSKKGKEVAMQ